MAAALEGVRRRVRLLLPRPRRARCAGGRRRAGGDRDRRGVERLVLLSGRGEEEAQRSEEALASAGAGWTIVRSAGSTRTSARATSASRSLAGELALPAGDVGEPFVDADDIADVAVAALTEDGHVGEVYEVTGPAADLRARRSRRSPGVGPRAPLRADRGRRLRRRARRARASPDEVGLLRYLFGEVLDGRNAYVADGVERALGRPPRDFADYARAAAAGGAWDVTRGRVATSA